LPERPVRPAFLDLTALAVCLVGFLGLITVVTELKAGVTGIPRPVFLVFLAMICAPFYLALVHTPKFPYLIPPIIAIFLLYPVATPHGIVWGTDTIFNFAFTADVAGTGFWSPGTGHAFANGYSFYPVGNVFFGYIILTAALPPATAFIWIEPMLRLLAVPATAYAIGRRLFGIRIAILGLFFYLGTASILFNTPVQQGMGIIFVALALLTLLLLTQSPSGIAQRRAQVLFVLVGGAIVMTHHLSSYIFAGWLAVLAVLLSRRRLRPDVPPFRLGILFLYFIAILGLYILTVTSSIFLTHEASLEAVVNRFLSPESIATSTTGPSLGRTFSLLEILWLGGSVIGLLVLALFSIHLFRLSRRHPFAVANGLVGAALVFGTLPLIPTALSFVPLRVSEYANLIVTPFAAATVVRWTRSRTERISRLPRSRPRERGWLPPVAVLLVSALLFMGGNLAPITMRMYFEGTTGANARTTESPLLIGADVIRATDWARTYYGSKRVWGDQMVVNAFSGFADMDVAYGSHSVFNGTTVDSEAWLCRVVSGATVCRLSPGDYVIINRWMTVYRPNFLNEFSSDKPLSPAQVDKFATDPHFALVYQDTTITVYRVMFTPPF
jgi:hypothetical protein